MAQVRAKMSERKGKTGNKIEKHDWPDSIYNPIEIHLQYLPDDVLLARACITPASSTEEKPQPGSACALAGPSTSPANHRKKAKVKVRRGLGHQVYVEVRERQPGKPRHERQAEVRLEP
jgi:hypothetical protein